MEFEVQCEKSECLWSNNQFGCMVCACQTNKNHRNQQGHKIYIQYLISCYFHHLFYPILFRKNYLSYFMFHFLSQIQSNRLSVFTYHLYTILSYSNIQYFPISHLYISVPPMSHLYNLGTIMIKLKLQIFMYKMHCNENFELVCSSSWPHMHLIFKFRLIIRFECLKNEFIIRFHIFNKIK